MNHPPRFEDELRIVPRWVLALAIGMGLALIVTFNVLGAFGVKDFVEWPIRYLAAPLGAVVVAVWITAIGYVNRDAARRQMSAGGWTLAVIFLPNAIGFILYFLLRRPLPQRCPRCGSVITAEYNHCPRCGAALHPACPHCGRTIRAGDAFCAYCGGALAVATGPQV